MGSTSHETRYKMRDSLRMCPVLISPAFDEAQRSVSCTMLFIVRTDSTVYFPFADSPLQFYRMKNYRTKKLDGDILHLNMTQSAPSITAFATSVHSARVGRGLFCILSSICVATITEILRIDRCYDYQVQPIVHIYLFKIKK